MSEEIKINGEEENVNAQATPETEAEATAEAVENPTEASAEEAAESAEDVEVKVEEATAPSEEAKLIEELKDENAKLKDQLLRTIAEFDNYKKRTVKEKQELIFNGGQKTITAILPVLDDFERAETDPNNDPTALREGRDLIFKKFIKTLEGLGVKKIEAVGEDFDVDFHEAVAMVPVTEDEKKGKVIDCIQTGYQLNDKVIRHAKVAVGQ